MKPPIHAQDVEGFHVATQPAPPAPSDKPLITAQGYSALLELWPDKVVIKRQGINGLILRGFKGDKEILLQSIVSIQFEMPGSMVNGYIQFVLRGARKAQSGFQAAQDENSVVFLAAQVPAFEQIKEAVYRQRKVVLQQSGLPIGLPTDLPTASAVESVNDLAELISLRDRGLITNTEFHARRKRILGL